MPLSIDVVIPTYNGWELTESCLLHLQQQTLPHDTIVSDNASTDGTPQKVRTGFPSVTVVETGGNLGFPVACNRAAEAGDGDVIVLLNNDVDCQPDFLEHLLAPLASDERIGSVASLLLQPGGEVIDSIGLTADRTLAGFPRLHGLPADATDSTTPLLVGPSGGAGAYRRRAWEEVDGFDESVFIYLEDLDLALRLRTAGWECAVAPRAVGIHHGSATMGKRSRRQRWHAGFSRAYFLRRYGVLRGSAATRAALTEAIVVCGDVLLSRDLVAPRSRLAGWRAGGPYPRRPQPPAIAIDGSITLLQSLRLRIADLGSR